MSDKPLPYSLESEKGILGTMLLDPDSVLAEIATVLKPEHFYTPAHGVIYSTLLDMWKNASGEKIDFITLTAELGKHNLLDAVGGPSVPTGFFTYVPTTQNRDVYLNEILEKWVLRQIIAKGTEYAGRAYDEQDDVAGLLNGFSGDVAAISMQDHTPDISFKDRILRHLDRLENNRPDLNAIPTGLKSLDRHSSLKLGSMPVIAGERKSGKSILAMNIAKAIALDGWPVVYFSLEDPAEEMVARIFANESRIPIERQFPGVLTNAELDRCATTAARIAAMDLIIKDDIYDVAGIAAFTKKIKAQKPDLKAIVVDYVQLVRGEQKKGSNREQEIAGISRQMRLLSMQLNIAVILLSQLNKDGDTRESKAIEQDCTALWKVNRVYKERSRKDEEPEEEQGKRMLVIPFQRNGASGIGFPLAFIGQLYRFEELAKESGN